MKQAGVSKRFYFIILLSLTYLTCSKDTLFDPQGHALSIPYAFVSPTPKNSISTLADSSGLAIIDTVVKGKPLYFIGLISSPQNGLKASWNFGDNQTAATAITQHAFGQAGKYVAQFSIEDPIGNKKSDTVTVYAVSIPVIDSMILPANGDTDINPDSIVFSWRLAPADPGDTLFSSLLVGINPTALSPLVNGIKSQTYLDARGVYSSKYYWRVVAKSAFGQIDTSAIDSFSTAGPVAANSKLTITKITSDTIIKVGDSVMFSAVAEDSGSTISLYSWDFDQSGVFDISGPNLNSYVHRFSTEGAYNVVFQVTDANNQTAQKTIKVLVINTNIQVTFASPDTIVDFGGMVRCSLSVNTAGSNLSFAIDTAHTGNYVPMKQSGSCASFVFSTGSASAWDSVKMRTIYFSVDTIFAGFKVSIRPETLTIIGIDSTDSTITVNWSKSKATNFQEYLLYRGANVSVDTATTLLATISQANTASYIIQVPTHTALPGYYRIYQKDNLGLLSAGSNVVFGNTMNAPPSKPVIINPSKGNDTLLSNATILWHKCIDPNGDPVTYTVQIKIDSAAFRTLKTGITDTFYTLKNYGDSTFLAAVRVVASDDKGATSSAERLNIYFQQVKYNGMMRVFAGTITDDQGNTAIISHDFFVDTVEVTQGEFRAVMPVLPSQTNIGNQFPVQNVSWFQAIMYCNALSKQANLDTVYDYATISDADGASGLICNWGRNGFRLPTEDEWELAAKGGENFTYATFNGKLSCPNANYGAGACGPNGTVLVASYAPNPYNLYDLTGNVSEWCWDRYIQASAGRTNNRIDFNGPAGFGLLQARSIRGGNFTDTSPLILESAYRSSSLPNTKYAVLTNIGFRCVRMAP
jgi:formylglycine-generating enzyme required for sulfatase activity